MEDFYLPFSGELNPENRWVKLSKNSSPGTSLKEIHLIVRDGGKGAQTETGKDGPCPRALIIKETLVLSDEELVNQLTENPYFQYFIGLPEFQKEKLRLTLQ